MPIFEATPRKSNLTPQQIKEAERALFGPPQVDQAALPEHDEKIRTIDLNNPPTPPYRYQEYPRMMYLHGDAAQFLIVQNEAQREVAERRGFTPEIAVPEQPPPPEYAEDEEGDEDENFDEQLAGISGPVPDEAEVQPVTVTPGRKKK
jgi:hypothetical protein